MISLSRVRTAALFGVISLTACGGGGGEGVPQPAEPPVSPPPRLGPIATTVIGQASFIENQANRGGTVAANTLDFPIGNVAFSDNGTLFIPDSFNGRVLAYRNVPASNGAAADFVIGKPALDAPSSGNASQSFIQLPTSVSIAGGKMAVVDADAHRVLIFGTVPTSDTPLASFVVGQANFTDKDSRGCFSHALNLPRSAVLAVDGEERKLIVADTENHRVLIWNDIPTADGRSADVVLGQEDFTHCTANDANQDNAPDDAPTASTLRYPMAVWSDGVRLIVADGGNHRILIWTQLPTTNLENLKAANIVLGQPSFSANTPNDSNQDALEDSGPAAGTLNDPRAVYSDGTRLVVADSGNNRVMLWNTMPTQSNTSPDRVFGQSDFSRGQPNDNNQDGVSDTAASDGVLFQPRGVFLRDSTLFVSDAGNNRVLLFRLDP